MTAATCNGITIEYEEYGSGEPLLLIMGLSGQLVAWPMDWVQRWVELGFRVIRFDNRDIGLSSKMPGEPPTIARIVRAAASRRLARSDYLLRDIADDSVGVLDHLGIDKAHIVGVSMGGMIAQCMAIDHPERVKSLTSIMSNTGDRRHGRPRASLLRKLPKVVARTPEQAVDKSVETFRLISGPHFDEVEVRHLAELALKRGFDADGAARQAMAVLASSDRTAALAGVRAPTLVIHGLVDPLVMPSGGMATARAIPGSRLLMFPDMGHDLPRPRWDEIIAAILDNTRRGGFTG